MKILKIFRLSLIFIFNRYYLKLSSILAWLHLRNILTQPVARISLNMTKEDQLKTRTLHYSWNYLSLSFITWIFSLSQFTNAAWVMFGLAVLYWKWLLFSRLYLKIYGQTCALPSQIISCYLHWFDYSQQSSTKSCTIDSHCYLSFLMFGSERHASLDLVLTRLVHQKVKVAQYVAPINIIVWVCVAY